LDITIVSLAGAEFPKTISYDIVNINDDDKEQPNPVKQVPTVSVTCVVCEYAIGMLQKDLKENATQDEIRASLDALCEKLPSAIINECESLVTQYSEELIDALVLNLTPEQTCRYLMLCQPPSKPTADVVMVAPEARDSKMMDSFLVYDPLKEMTQKRKLKVEVSPGCILCEFVMRELDDILKDNRTEVSTPRLFIVS
jgi:saposin